MENLLRFYINKEDASCFGDPLKYLVAMKKGYGYILLYYKETFHEYKLNIILDGFSHSVMCPTKHLCLIKGTIAHLFRERADFRSSWFM